MPKDTMDALLIAAGPPKMGKGAGPDDGLNAKAREMRRFRGAIERKDDQAAAASFKALYDLCAAAHGPGDDEDEEPEEDDGEEY